MQGSPHARRVRIFLAEKGIEVDKINTDVVAGENLTDKYLAMNPRGVVPTLELDDATVVDETSAICRYFEEANDSVKLYGKDPKSKAVIESWIRQIEGDCFTPTADILRNSNPIFKNRSVPGTNDTPQVPALAERGADRVQTFYSRLNKQLEQNIFVTGDEFSAADISAMCAVDFAEYVGVAVPENLTSLKRWHGEVASRPSATA